MSTQEKTLKARNATLQQYVSDMVAVEEHIAAAVKRQAEDQDVAKKNPQASQIIQQIARLTERHAQDLKQHLESIGGDPAKGVKEIAAAALGAVAGLYDKVRTEQVSKMMRDDYTALSLAAMGYTMLHTTGLSVQDSGTASLALRHLKDYTPLVMQLSEIIPTVVVDELRDDGVVLVEGSAQQAIKNTQEAWTPSNSGNGSNGGKNSASI